jgi:hypothetical protein
MSHVVDFRSVSTVGLEASPVAAALAGLRAVEARYFKNKFDHAFTVEPANKASKAIAWASRVENIRIAFVFYESGLAINVMYDVDDPKRRAVGWRKLKLAGTVRGSYFAIKGEH